MYYLILWPFSQEFIGKEGCYFYSNNGSGEFDIELSQAVFVPEELLDDQNNDIKDLSGGIAGQYLMVDDVDSDETLIGLSYDEDDEDEAYFEPQTNESTTYHG